MTSVVDLFLRISKGAAFGLLFFIVASCSAEPKLWKISGDTMGTQYHISALPPKDFDTEVAAKDVDALLMAFSHITSTYILDSEVNRLSAFPLDETRKISHILSDILLISMEVSWITGGAFDVTVSPLVDLWGFGAEQREQNIPAASAIAAALEEVGFQHLQLDVTEPKVKLSRPLRVDLSGVAKGYGVDMVAQWLERQGIDDYLVDIGGEIRAAGKSPRGDDWRVGIEKPAGLINAGVSEAIRVGGVGLATSGDYRNYFEKDGKRYSHTINPKTGYPISHTTASVTVIAETSAYADALATGLLVLGAEKSLALAETHGIAVYLIEKTGDGFKSSYSSAFAPYIE
ncbi:MAG: thiamine biosynthesis lipoprotein [Bermanella sp.]|jgi:thiamine biosynthesis lipoprotein